MRTQTPWIVIGIPTLVIGSVLVTRAWMMPSVPPATQDVQSLVAQEPGRASELQAQLLLGEQRIADLQSEVLGLQARVASLQTEREEVDLSTVEPQPAQAEHAEPGIELASDLARGLAHASR